MSYITGKALLVITRNDSKYDKYYIVPYVQSANSNFKPEVAKDAAREDLAMLDYAGGVLPCMRRMKPGEVLRIHVVYDIQYTTSYWDNEADVLIEIEKCRVLRRQPWKKDRYIDKATRAKDEVRRAEWKAKWGTEL